MQTIAVIPDSHRDLLDRPVVVTLVTLMPDGQPQATPVWCDFDGEFVRVNTARGRQKDKNMSARPQVTVLAIDPENPYRWMEVRGRVASMDDAEGVNHINKLSGEYVNQPDYYARQPERRGKEQRVMVRIMPTRVITGG